MLPTRSGDFDLGPLRFYYFDPEKAAYDSLVVPELKVKVTGDDIENQRIGKSGTDDFYVSAFGASSAAVTNGNRVSMIVFVSGMVLVIGMVTTGLMRRRKVSKVPKQENEDFWSK